MKTLIVCFPCLLCLTLLAQEKGVSSVTTVGKAETGTTYAVVVGISDYGDEGIPDLRFADQDAKAFANFLRSPAGGSLDEDHLKVLINDQATGAQISIALDELIDVAAEGDKVIIYFSGHGDVESKRISQPGYLLGWDAPPQVYMAGGAVNVRDLRDIVSTLSVQNKAKVILVTDACRAGKLSGSGIGGSQATAANLAKQFANEIKILSCQPDEYSIEGEQWGGGRGAFSYHLLDGLYGMADKNADQSVNLMEIRGYLEDHVSTEVAPESQLPMVVGNGRENLVDVFPEILVQLKEGKKGQLQLFTPTESRGIEDEVLAAADTGVVEKYLAFQQSLKDKQFLEPATACADFYYEQLIKEPSLKRLHSNLRRNYAAALQDDAQQVMNTMLKSGLTEDVLKGYSTEDIYKNYPSYLERAAELLGKEHYMHETLQARKLFFEGMIQNESKQKRIAFLNALVWQPEMAHAMVYLARTYEAEQLDSAEYYTQKAMELIPTWVEPYIAMADFYGEKLKQTEKEEEMLNLAGQVDSTAVMVWYKKALFYHYHKKYNAAEEWYLKTIEGTGEDICFPCIHGKIGALYTDIFNDFEKGEYHFKKSLDLDSISSKGYYTFCRPCAYSNLGTVYHKSGRIEEAILNFRKAIELDSTFVHAYSGLAIIYASYQQDDEKAEKMFSKAVELNPNFAQGWVNLGLIYTKTNQFDKVEDAFDQAIKINHHYATPFAYNGLGEFYIEQEKFDEAESNLKKAIELNLPQFMVPYQRLVYVYMKTDQLNAAKATLDEAIKMNPEYPDMYILYAHCEIKDLQPEKAWNYLEQALEKGYNAFERLQSEPDFEEMRKDPRWKEIMEKYFPDQMKN